MKQVRNLIFSAVLLLISLPLFSQGGLASASEECRRSVAFYNDYIKQNNLDEAAPLWREAFHHCPPGIRESIYRDGIRLYKYFISKNRDNQELRNSLIDTMLMMYDLRVEYFPKNAISASTFKVYDMLEYRGESDMEIVEAVNSAMEIGEEETDPSLLVIAMQRMGALYGKGQKSSEEVLEAYSLYTSMIDEQIANDKSEAIKAKNDIDNLFVGCGVANCENIVRLFTPRFRENPDDTELASTIVSLLSSAGCTSEPLFLETVEKLYESDPENYLYIRNLYLLYAAKGDQANAIKMLQQAIDSEESSDAEDANMLITMANYYLQLENLPKAAENARLAIEKDGAVAGRANLILGLVWASVKCSGNEIETRAKYWVAVDYLIKARNLDSSLATEANNYIGSYSQYFPTQEDAFMYNVIDGTSYSVNCGGMRANTVVRTKK